MKNLISIAFLFFICMLILSCANSPKSDQNQKISEAEKQIAKNLIQGSFDDLWAGVDSTKISKYHTDDFIILEHGEVWDNDRIKEFMRGQLAREDRAKRINIMDYISIEKYGPSMQIAYHNRAEFYQKDSLVWEGGWLESATAIKTPEGWRLKMMHSTRKSK